MIELFLLGVAFIGSIVAGVVDLKTTEIPDWIPYVMMGVGITGNLVQSVLTGSYMPILMSMLVGMGYLGFGFLMYFTGQWGGGDAKILSGIGFLVPMINIFDSLMFPFYIGFLFNVFFIGAIYMILYIIVLSMMNRKICKEFFKRLKADSRYLPHAIIFMVVFLVIFNYMTAYNLKMFTIGFSIKFSAFISLMSFSIFILYKFAKTVEDVGFRKRIPISDLKEGDVLIDSKVWEGITEKELKEVKKSGKKYVWVKEGVRFAPAFPLALAFTIYFGEGFIWFLKFGL